MSWMKYELWGLVLVVIGALVAAGTAGIDTGNIGLSLDDIFAYAFGTGRMLVALMLVAAGLQYIVKRKALPFTRNWLMGAVVFELLLSLWHVIFTNPGEEFVRAPAAVFLEPYRQLFCAVGSAVSEPFWLLSSSSSVRL